MGIDLNTNDRSLIRSAVVDYGHLTALQRLIFGPLSPSDLPLVEQALRALITVEQLRPVPFIELEKGGLYTADVLTEESGQAPIGDHILDYEFIYEPDRISPLPILEREEEIAISRLVVNLLERAYGKPVFEITTTEIAKDIDPSLMGFIHDEWRMMDPDVADEDEENRWARDVMESCDDHPGRDKLTLYARTLVRFHRAGAVVFSQGLIGQACQEHLFSRYPSSIFDHLDQDWHKHIRQTIGPGIGVVVPPILACVLSKVGRRDDIPSVVRDMRDKYRASRESLWNYLEEMWCAPTLKKQLQLLSKLEEASEHLFKASFPERFRFLQTAFSTAIKAAELKPLSAMEEIGKSLLKKDESTSRVSAIGFTRQLSLDLRNVGGMGNLLRKVLTRAEAAEFGLS